MFFGNTKGGRDLLELWQKETSKHPGKADDRILSMAIMLHNALAPLNTIQLPIEYLWLDLSYGPEVPMIKGRDYEDIVISHPECLTGEDRATSEGAASNRYPRGVLYIDGDMKVLSYPSVFDMNDIDYMARGWNTDSRPGIGRKKGLACFDPFVF